MTLPKGYVKPSTETAEEKARKEAEEKARKEAEEDTSVPVIISEELSKTKNLDIKTESIGENVYSMFSKRYGDLDYELILDRIKEAYLSMMREYTSSYLRLLDLWSQSFKK